MSTKRPQTMAELRDEVLDALAAVKDDPRRCAQANEISALAGKVVGMCKIHLERAAINGVKSTGDWDMFISGDARLLNPPTNKSTRSNEA